MRLPVELSDLPNETPELLNMQNNLVSCFIRYVELCYACVCVLVCWYPSFYMCHIHVHMCTAQE